MREADDEPGVLIIVSDDAGTESFAPGEPIPAHALTERLQHMWDGRIHRVGTIDELAGVLEQPGAAVVAVDVGSVGEQWFTWRQALHLSPLTTGELREVSPVDSVPVILIGDDRYWPRMAEALAVGGADCVRLPCDDIELRARLHRAARLASVREDERRRLAQAIHADSLQVLAVSAMRLQLLRRRLPGDVGELDEIADQLRDAVEGLRTLDFETARTPAPGGPRADAAFTDATLPSAAQSMWASRELLSKLGHDLRSPLNAVLGFAQLLDLAPDLNADHADAVHQIIRAGQRLLDLINEVVDLSRIEAGVLDMSLEQVELDELLRDAADLMQPAAAEAGVQLRGVARDNWSAPGGEHVTVMADRQRLLQVLLILLANAVRYNRPGGHVNLDVTCDGSSVRVTVADTGRGIPAEKLDKVFVPFDRLGADKQGPDGAGLGLPIARGLLARMGGHLGVESAPDEGSTFWFELRVAPVHPADQPDAEVREHDAELPSGRPFEVLYIEDNPSSLRLVEQVLRRRPGVMMIPAMQGRLGLQLAAQRQPSMVLVDLHLPDMAGIDVVRLLVSEPATKDIPVVVLSADATRDQEARLQGEGARAFLSKPFQIDTLLDLVDNLRAEYEHDRAITASDRGEPAGAAPVPEPVRP